MGLYTDSIRKLAPDYDPRHVEAYMRIGHATLDDLSPALFRREVLIAVECIEMEGKETAESLAKSFGLR